MPKPTRKPVSRATSTEMLSLLMSSIAIFAFAASSPRVAAAHLPIKRPASKLSVAKVMSCASGSASGVSSAITRTPAARASIRAGVTESFDAVIRMPFAPAATQFSIAEICGAASPSVTPANAIRFMPSSLARASAPSRIFTKNGLVLFFVMRHRVPAEWLSAIAAPDIATRASAEPARSFFMVSSQEFQIRTVFDPLYPIAPPLWDCP